MKNIFKDILVLMVLLVLFYIPFILVPELLSGGTLGVITGIALIVLIIVGILNVFRYYILKYSNSGKENKKEGKDEKSN